MGLSARALRARSTAHLLRPLDRLPSHLLGCAWLALRTAAVQEMRRGGSRREPALSPYAGGPQ